MPFFLSSPQLVYYFLSNYYRSNQLCDIHYERYRLLGGDFYLYLMNVSFATLRKWTKICNFYQIPNPLPTLPPPLAPHPSLRKQPTFGDATTGFPAK